MALFRKLDFSLGRGAEWGAQMRDSKPIHGHTRAGARPSWHMPGDHIALGVTWCLPGALGAHAPTPCVQGAAWCLVITW